jgi:hypothetical protein
MLVTFAHVPTNHLTQYNSRTGYPMTDPSMSNCLSNQMPLVFQRRSIPHIHDSNNADFCSRPLKDSLPPTPCIFLDFGIALSLMFLT